MFTVIYDKETSKVLNIYGGVGNYADVLTEEKASIVVENLPQHNMFRQYLAVIDDALVVKDYELTPEKERSIRQSEILQEISYYKNQFEQSRYKLEKYVDGALTEEEYAPIREERAVWRLRINELEQELQELFVAQKEFENTVKEMKI